MTKATTSAPRNIQSDRRKSLRVSDALAMRVEHANNTNHTAPLGTNPTHVVKLSNAGLHFQHEQRLPTDGKILLTMCLGPQCQTVSLTAKVLSSTEVKDTTGVSRFDARVQFTGIDNQSLSLLDQHIEYVLQQTSSNCRVYDYAAIAS